MITGTIQSKNADLVQPFLVVLDWEKKPGKWDPKAGSKENPTQVRDQVLYVKSSPWFVSYLQKSLTKKSISFYFFFPLFFPLSFPFLSIMILSRGNSKYKTILVVITECWRSVCNVFWIFCKTYSKRPSKFNPVFMIPVMVFMCQEIQAQVFQEYVRLCSLFWKKYHIPANWGEIWILFGYLKDHSLPMCQFCDVRLF